MKFYFSKIIDEYSNDLCWFSSYSTMRSYSYQVSVYDPLINSYGELLLYKTNNNKLENWFVVEFLCRLYVYKTL